MPTLRTLRLGLFCVITACALGGGHLWFDNLKPEPQARVAVGFLVGLEIAYAVVLASVAVGIPLLTSRALRLRRARRPFPATARLLLLAVSTLFALIATEACVAVLDRSRGGGTSPVEESTALHVERGSVLHQVVNAPEIPFPTAFPDESAPDDVDVAVLGESSAAGIPYAEWFSLGEVVRRRLAESLPNRHVRLHRSALAGDTLRGQRTRFAELPRRPDVVVIYCGHNEFSARFHWWKGARHYADAEAPDAWTRLVNAFERLSPLASLTARTADRWRVAIPPPPGGRRDLVDVPVYTSEEYRALLADFENGLDRIVAHTIKLGAVPILIVPPANDSEFEPNRSFLPAGTPAAERRAFAREFLAARDLEASNPDEALRRYRSLLPRGGTFAELHFRIGRLLERSGAIEEAARHDALARDFDGLPMRAPTSFLDAHRRVAARHGCPLIDGPALFRSISAKGLLDDSVLHDAMHPSLRGHFALAQAVLAELHARKAFGLPPSVPRLDVAATARALGVDAEAWRKVCLWISSFYELAAPLRYDPRSRIERRARWRDAALRIGAGVNPADVGIPGVGDVGGLPD